MDTCDRLRTGRKHASCVLLHRGVRLRRFCFAEVIPYKSATELSTTFRPTIAIITVNYFEKLAVDAMIENKVTFVRQKAGLYGQVVGDRFEQKVLLRFRRVQCVHPGHYRLAPCGLNQIAADWPQPNGSDLDGQYDDSTARHLSTRSARVHHRLRRWRPALHRCQQTHPSRRCHRRLSQRRRLRLR